MMAMINGGRCRLATSPRWETHRIRLWILFVPLCLRGNKKKADFFWYYPISSSLNE
jgi:hypothetical protein